MNEGNWRKREKAPSMSSWKYSTIIIFANPAFGRLKIYKFF